MSAKHVNGYLRANHNAKYVGLRSYFDKSTVSIFTYNKKGSN